MAKNFNPKATERQFQQKLRKMIGSVLHTQNVADQALEIAGTFMNEKTREDSDICRVIENVSCVCEEALQVLLEELQKGTRLHEILTVEPDDVGRNMRREPVQNDRAALISWKDLKSILGERVYQKIDTDLLRVVSPLREGEGWFVPIKSIPMESLSQEEMAAILSCARKRDSE